MLHNLKFIHKILYHNLPKITNTSTICTLAASLPLSLDIFGHTLAVFSSSW